MPPDIDPPPNCSWLGEWEATEAWDSTMSGDEPGHPLWMRWALPHDGHEECCNHQWPYVVDRIVE